MEGWKTVRVADVAAPSSNAMATGPFGSSIGSRFFRSSGVPIIRGGNLSADSAIRISDENLVFLAPEKAAEFTRSTVRRGDLIFTSWGTINQVGLIDGSASFDEYVISNKQMKLTPDPRIALPEFLYYLFSSPAMQREILEGSIGSSIPGFNLTRLRSIAIHLPPIEEQKQIARALSDAEHLETSLGKTIAKKQAIKQGMMQQLLTGRTRLSGYSGSWLQTSLGSLGTFMKGRGIKRDEVSAAGIPCIRYGEVYTTFNDYTSEVRSFVSSEVAASALPLRSGDLLFTGSGETRDEIGKCVAYIGRAQAVAGGDLIVLRGTGFNSVYVALLANSPTVVSQKARAGQGDAVVHVSSRALANVRISLPPLAEQNAVAAVILDVDRELDALKQRQKKVHDIKQGMMQALFTGHTRLQLQGAAA